MRYFFVLLTFLLGIPGFTQLPLIFREDFNDNSNDWPLGADDDIASAEIRDGHYVYKLFSDEYIYRFKNSLDKPDLSDLKEFKITVRLKQVSGDSDAYYGIIWDSDCFDYCHEFMINSTGHFRVINKTGDDDYDYVVPGTKTGVVNPKGQYNELTVHRHGWYYDFSINGHLVSRITVPRMQVYGNDFGFSIYSPGTVMVDYVEIRGKKRTLNIVRDPISSKKINLGSAVNTSASEISPLITADGKALYFVRRADSDDDDNIFVSYKKNGKWTKAIKLPPPFNNEYNNSVNYVSSDGNTFIVTGAYDNGVFLQSDGISLIQKTSSGSFSQPQNIILTNYKNDWEYYSFTFSQDRNIMIMAITYPGNCFGDADLYVSFLQPDGSYSQPKNLGPVINTPYNEGTPFLAPDGVTLYFSSSGHPGYGDRDIFVTRRLDDTWQHWTVPQNLGNGVNSSGWDAYFTIDAAGEYAYLVSDSQGYGEEDIFMIRLDSLSRPNPVAFVTGRVYDSLTGKNVYAKIYYSTGKGQLKDYSVSDANSGTFRLVLPVDKTYLITVVAKGYMNYTGKIEIPASDTIITLSVNYPLKPIKAGNSIVLENVYFPAGKAVLIPESYAALDRLVAFMKQNPDVTIEISGHTNNIGDKKRLKDLSVRRAEAVKQYLVKHGINPSRIKTVGYGPDRPIADNSTEAGRRKNQRVEFKILDK